LASLSSSGLAADTDPSAGDEFKDSDGKDAKGSSTSGNPLEDVNSATRIVGVMVRGQWLSEADLRHGLDAIPLRSSKGN
jgi:hypothetical protein